MLTDWMRVAAWWAAVLSAPQVVSRCRKCRSEFLSLIREADYCDTCLTPFEEPLGEEDEDGIEPRDPLPDVAPSFWSVWSVAPIGGGTRWVPPRPSLDRYDRRLGMAAAKATRRVIGGRAARYNQAISTGAMGGHR